MVGSREIALMKQTVVLINCARGGVIQEKALAEALKENRIFMAAVDVFTEEPLPT